MFAKTKYAESHGFLSLLKSVQVGSYNMTDYTDYTVLVPNNTNF